jgi:hypothetical protein
MWRPDGEEAVFSDFDLMLAVHCSIVSSMLSIVGWNLSLYVSALNRALISSVQCVGVW